MTKDLLTPNDRPARRETPLAEAAASTRNGNYMLRWAGGGTFVLTVISIGLACGFEDWELLRFEWVIWLLALQSVGLLVLLQRFARAVTLRNGVCLIILNCWLIRLAGLYHSGMVGYAVAVAADLLLRAAILGVWSIALVGLPWIVYWNWRQRRPLRAPFHFGIGWFSALAILIAVELFMAQLDPCKDVIAFPEQLPPPPADELRIVGVGESTMYGTPYGPKFSIPKIVAWQVQQMYPQRKVLSENISVPGQSLQQAIACLPRLKYRPQLMLLYSGHNEFFYDTDDLVKRNECRFATLDAVFDLSPTFRFLNSRLRTCIALRPPRMAYFDEPVNGHFFSPALIERKRLQFKSRLERFARFAQSQGIAMLWYIPGGVEAGYEPNASFVATGTSAEEISALKQCWREALERERAEDWTAAVELYRAALMRHPQFAEFHFRLGECFLRLGQIDEARRHFQAALDNDGRPSRQTLAFRKTLTDVAAAFSIPVVVAGDALRPYTQFEILDRSLFHDFVHPTLRGHYYLGIAGAERLRTSGLLESRFGPPADIPAARFTDAVQEFQIDRADVARALRDIATGLRWHARFRFNRTRRAGQADEYVRLAERLEEGQIEPGDEGTEALH